MHYLKKLYHFIYNKLMNVKFFSYYSYRIKRILTSTIKFYIPFVTIIVLLFGVLYYYYGTLEFSNNTDVLDSFIDNFYFSAVTFFSVGYGDIYPTTELTKIIVIIQEFSSFIILTLFSGFVIATFFVRRNDVFFDDKLVIRFNGNNFVLSFAIMNQGAMFYDMNGSLSLTLSDKYGMINRYSLIHNYTTWFRKIWYCEFEINHSKFTDNNYLAVYEILYMIITSQELIAFHPKFKISIHGTDSETRDIAYYIKEYYLYGMSLKFIENYLDGSKGAYNKFGKFTSYMEDDRTIEFFQLLQNIIFPKNEAMKVSVTGLFRINNKHIDITNYRFSKDINID